jgi:hypothetical protein
MDAGEPVAGCAVCISTLDRWAGDGQLNSGSTFGRSTVTSEKGHVLAKVRAQHLTEPPPQRAG